MRPRTVVLQNLRASRKCFLPEHPARGQLKSMRGFASCACYNLVCSLAEWITITKKFAPCAATVRKAFTMLRRTLYLRRARISRCISTTAPKKQQVTSLLQLQNWKRPSIRRDVLSPSIYAGFPIASDVRPVFVLATKLATARYARILRVLSALVCPWKHTNIQHCALKHRQNTSVAMRVVALIAPPWHRLVMQSVCPKNTFAEPMTTRVVQAAQSSATKIMRTPDARSSNESVENLPGPSMNNNCWIRKLEHKAPSRISTRSFGSS